MKGRRDRNPHPHPLSPCGGVRGAGSGLSPLALVQTGENRDTRAGTCVTLQTCGRGERSSPDAVAGAVSRVAASGVCGAGERGGDQPAGAVPGVRDQRADGLSLAPPRAGGRAAGRPLPPAAHEPGADTGGDGSGRARAEPAASGLGRPQARRTAACSATGTCPPLPRSQTSSAATASSLVLAQASREPSRASSTPSPTRSGRWTSRGTSPAGPAAVIRSPCSMTTPATTWCSRPAPTSAPPPYGKHSSPPSARTGCPSASPSTTARPGVTGRALPTHRSASGCYGSVCGSRTAGPTTHRRSARTSASTRR